jgi:N-acetyl-anhydromuramyl-L-alanine amidase AmpD
MTIKQVAMERSSLDRGRSGPVRVVVMHATAGFFPSDFNWLRKGGGKNRQGVDVPVSVHYYIDKKGNVTQMVSEEDTAWHAGKSRWDVDGRPIVDRINAVSVGIELENNNKGNDPYPPAQYSATLALTRELVARYNIPRRQLVRHLDISPGRKTDPAGFPWERFVNEVYNGVPMPPPTPDRPAPPTPPAEPLQPDQQVRKLLIDLAYRAAGGGVAAGWPLLKETVTRNTGMPVAIMSTPAENEGGEGEDDSSRPLLLPGLPPLLVEAYGRDLYYSLLDEGSPLMRLSESGPGPVRDELLKALFSHADPANGFQPGWAFHQLFLQQPTQIGVPLGPNHMLPGNTSDGRRFACQHFAADSLASPTNDFSQVIRLSDLTRDMYSGDPHAPVEKELRTMLLNDLYQARTGRNFEPSALFCRFAVVNGVGAPTAKAEVQIVGDKKYVAMPYTLDVLYCRIPPDGNWDRVAVGVLGTEDASGLGRLSQLLSVDALAADAAGTPPPAASSGVLGAAAPAAVPAKIYGGGVLGRQRSEPHIVELAAPGAGQRGQERDGGSVELVVVYPTYGSASQELAGASQPGGSLWHYYVGRDGTIVRLVDEERATRAAGPAAWRGRGDIDARSVAVAVEGAATSLDPDGEQAGALRWLLGDLAARYSLGADQIIQAADLAPRIDLTM